MLRDFFRKYGWNYIPGAIFLVLSTWIQTRAPLVLGNAIELFTGSDYAAFAREAWRTLTIAVGVFFTRIAWRYFIIGTSREMEIYLRDRLFWHLEYLPIRFYSENRSGDLMAYAINDVGAVRMTFGMVMAQSLTAITSIGFSVNEMALGVHPRLTLFALLPVPVAIFFILFIGQSVQVKFRRVQELFSQLSGHVQENINGMRVLKAFAMEKQQYEHYQQESDDMRTANLRLSYTSALLSPAIQTVFGVSYAIGLVYGGHLVADGLISLGDYVAFNSYLTMIVAPVTSIGRIVNMLQRGLASLKRLNALMVQPELPPFDRKEDGVPIRGGIEARHLSYSHPDNGQVALEDVSFTLAPGQKLGIAGKTGSGKSTLVLLITKLLEAPEGQLEQGEDDQDREQGHRHLADVGRDLVGEQGGGLLGGGHLRDGDGGVGPVQAGHDQAEHHHRQDGPDGAQGDEAEGVAAGVLVAAHGGQADAQGHDEGHRDGPRGDAAGVKGGGDHAVRGQEGQQEHHGVEKQQCVGQGDVQQHAHLGDDQEKAHPQGHRQDQGHVGHRGQLLGQHLQVRFGNGDHHPQHKAHHQGDAHPAGPADLYADAVPHGDHGHVHPQGEQPHPHHQQDGAEEEEHHAPRGEGGHGDADGQHDGGDGQHRGQGLPDFFHELFVVAQKRHQSVLTQKSLLSICLCVKSAGAACPSRR